MFVIHYYINNQMLDSYLHTMSEKIWLLFTIVLNLVFLQIPWQRQAFWNFQASKPFIHMPYTISIKPHPIPSTFRFSRFFLATAAILKFLSLKIICTHVRQNLWKVSSNSEHFKFFVFFCGFHDNGGHFENSESSLHIYS
jgi:hypothetical protein